MLVYQRVKSEWITKMNHKDSLASVSFHYFHCTQTHVGGNLPPAVWARNDFIHTSVSIMGAISKTEVLLFLDHRCFFDPKLIDPYYQLAALPSKYMYSIAPKLAPLTSKLAVHYSWFTLLRSSHVSFLWIPSLRSFHIYDPTHPILGPMAIPIESSPAHWHSDHSLELGGGVAQGQLNSDPTLLSVLRV